MDWEPQSERITSGKSRICRDRAREGKGEGGGGEVESGRQKTAQAGWEGGVGEQRLGELAWLEIGGGVGDASP